MRVPPAAHGRSVTGTRGSLLLLFFPWLSAKELLGDFLDPGCGHGLLAEDAAETFWTQGRSLASKRRSGNQTRVPP